MGQLLATRSSCLSRHICLKPLDQPVVRLRSKTREAADGQRGEVRAYKAENQTEVMLLMGSKQVEEPLLSPALAYYSKFVSLVSSGAKSSLRISKI